MPSTATAKAGGIATSTATDTGTPRQGRKVAFGWAGATPVVGDWNGDGKERDWRLATDGNGQGKWYRDINGNGYGTPPTPPRRPASAGREHAGGGRLGRMASGLAGGQRGD